MLAQIPKIAIIVQPVRSMRVVHHPASVALDGGFLCGKNS